MRGCLYKLALHNKDDKMRKTDTWQDNKDMVTHASREEEIEQMKRRKLHLKDEIYKIIDKNKLGSHA